MNYNKEFAEAFFGKPEAEDRSIEKMLNNTRDDSQATLKIGDFNQQANNPPSLLKELFWDW